MARAQRRFLSSAPIRHVSGQRNATASTTRVVPMPPATTEITGPNSAAVKPDSSAPNSFDVPMKILFTDETRPRISSGVTSCTIEPRMITLTLSNAPTRNNKPSDNQSAFDKPKMIGENRQQCGRTPEQHREQIERNRCQDHLFAEHESHSSDQAFPGAFLNLISGLRAAADRQNQNEKQKCTQSIQCVNKREPDVRNQQAADCRPDNCSNLK